MSRVLLRRVIKLEQRADDGKPPVPALILFPGQEQPEGFTGPLVRIQIIDGRKVGPL